MEVSVENIAVRKGNIAHDIILSVFHIILRTSIEIKSAYYHMRVLVSRVANTNTSK